MNPATSLFLDLARFTAALVVFLSHLTSREVNAVFPWVRWGHEAVVVFFVISGYVIGYVASTRERLPIEYAAARLGRLYSVVIPALLLTFFLDRVGMTFAPELDSLPNHEHSLLRLLVNAVFAQQIWNLTVTPLSNGPFWSLSYEFFYYCIFGASIFLQGKTRVFVTTVLLFCAGPRITAFFSLWLMGLGTFHLSGKLHPPTMLKWTGALISGTAFFGLLWLGNPLAPLHGALLAEFPDSFLHIGGIPIFLGDIPKLPEDFLIATSFSGMLFFVQGSLAHEGLKHRMAQLVRYLAGATFSLYLFHVPLMNFLVAVFHIPKTSSSGLAAVGLVVLSVCIALSHLFERRVSSFRRLFRAILQRVAILVR